MTGRPWLVGIVGGSGSGKTSVARELIRRLKRRKVDVTLLDMDAYYAPKEINKARFAPNPINYDHPKAWDVELMAAHGEAVASGGLAGSKGEARRAIAQGGVYVNGERVADGALLTDADLRHGRYVLVRRGKKVYGLADAGTA